MLSCEPTITTAEDQTKEPSSVLEYWNEQHDNTHPPHPVWLTVPPTVARPCWIAVSSTVFQTHPPPTFATGWPSLSVTSHPPKYRLRSMTTPPSDEDAPDVLCPPPRTARSYLCSVTNLMMWETSSGVFG